MPKEVIACGAVEVVMPLGAIGATMPGATRFAGRSLVSDARVRGPCATGHS
jgi:hypothetical protein